MNSWVRWQVVALLGVSFSLFSVGLVQDAYAGIPTIVSAEITGPTTITIVYNEAVTSALTDYSDLQFTTAGPGVLIGISGSGTDTIELTFLVPVGADETGTIDINDALSLTKVESVSTSQELPAQNNYALADRLISGSSNEIT